MNYRLRSPPTTWAYKMAENLDKQVERPTRLSSQQQKSTVPIEQKSILSHFIQKTLTRDLFSYENIFDKNFRLRWA